MEVIGVLDLLHGRAVHARGGRRESYAPVPAGPLLRDAGDAVGLARGYLSPIAGVRELYVADLDAIGGGEPQGALLRKVAALGAPLWVDAGVRTAAEARSVLAAGAARVVVGLETLERMTDLASIADAAGSLERVAFSLDLREGVPQTRAPGLAGATPAALAVEGAERGAGAVIVLDLARVGSGRGVDVALLGELRALLPPSCRLVAGGGVRDRRDIEALAAAGCDAALVASALLDGRLAAAVLEAARLFAGKAYRCHES
jgi:phosphoribosylformimino-5-aminoimidazole carboxamide ribotide isomerase